ncbi:MAG: septal ring lytic transglycosylase RlpA family protein [Saprospiraceae bacterium]|nr:septal ring lytic transglycosylase RlpA family protein [Saprospiraceae bacterium]
MKFIAKAMLTLFLSLTAYTLSAQEYGVASYYSDKFQGKSTASGELYDKDKYTAAHKTYPFGTVIKVTRLDNKKSVKVRVTDRGPYVNGRIVDISRKAAEALDLVADGTARVKVEVVDQAPDAENTPDPIVVTPTPPTPAPTQPEVVVPPAQTEAQTPAKAEPEVAKVPAPKKAEPVTPAPTQAPIQSPPNPPATLVKSELATDQNYSQFGLYKVVLEKPAQAGYAVQVASMTNYNNVMKQIADLQGHWFQNILLSIEPNPSGEPVYKLLLGPFDTPESANAYKASVKKKTGINGFVVNLTDIKY